ncbi:Acyl-CoA dehydrogenase [Sphingobium faniae]|nr:Acyl-CoA dehydrogenase [Sphingobium faniae]
MKLAYSDEDRAFQKEIRLFFAQELSPEIATKEERQGHLRRIDYADWQRKLAERGWAAPNWPKEYGGTGWSPVQRHIWEVEYGRACAPEISVIAIGLVGPVICRFGSEDQKARYLDPMLRGDIFFCQGFSEPQAGSDLANVGTRAVRDGDDYVISGQKIWTSHAPDADYMVCLCRTNMDVKPQAGLSMLIVPMDAPGLTVRPIETIDDAPSVSEVFLDEVRVPASELIGEEDKAWTYAKFLLNTERTHNAYIGILRRYVDRLKRAADRTIGYRRKLAMLEIDVDALEWSVLRVLDAAEGPGTAASASALKVSASELLLRAGELEMEQLGLAALPVTPHGENIASYDGFRSQFMYWRAASIFGGANEIQRSIIWGSLS